MVSLPAGGDGLELPGVEMTLGVPRAAAQLIPDTLGISASSFSRLIPSFRTDVSARRVR